MDSKKEVMIGNQAIARGLIEAGLEIAAAYPGTPSSEILPGVVYFKKMEGLKIHTEWSSNELCAFEVAFGAAAYGGARAACFMKQVGLDVAFPGFLRAREKVLEGGLVIVSCDDPGPQSSQTEQDTRLIATLFGIPVFDPASPEEAADVAYYALNWSFKNKIPVIIRSTHRVSHARQAVDLFKPGTRTVTLREGVCAGHGAKLGVVASGMSYSLVHDVIEELGAANDVSVYKVLRVYPFSEDLSEFVEAMDKVLVIEETDMVIEALIGNRRKVMGRADGTVPSSGEVTYDIVRDILSGLLQASGETKAFVPDGNIEKALSDIAVTPRPPKLCPGCSHRAAFFAMQYIWPDAIYPGDIGCYTLGTAQGAVDAFVDMGSGVTLAEGFYDAFDQDGKLIPILASVGDSTFFHACLAPLYDAVKNHKRFVLVIMDNSTTAMTGMQPTPQTGITVDGTATRSIAIEDIVAGLGVKYLRIVDPYDVPLTIGTIRDAFSYLQGDDMLPAVIIARRECLLLAKGKAKDAAYPARLEQDCVGCKSCFSTFDCPAMSFDPDLKKIRIDDSICINCGICYYACPVQPEGKELKKFKDSGKA
ncbi:MAG: indolepyruvate ferredoxin oxidoreductase, alpha subunit [Deltaproteobacteria bacterium]|nr:indolepyruvate ferredoxin oxidoreductase, alpha subunit [Deltaproteobacteria bacterium]